MNKEQGRLKREERKLFLEGEKNKSFEQRFFVKRHVRNSIFKKWCVAYMVTAISVVVAVFLLLALGVGINNRPLMDNSGSYSFAEKIVEFIVKLNFFDTSLKNDGDTNMELLPIQKPSDTNKDDGTDNETDIPPSADVGATVKDIYDFDYSKVPAGHTPIIPMDLSLSSYGSAYINNSTGYTPDIASLLNKKLKQDNGYEYLSASSKPVVLIIHTHGTEAYSPDGAISCETDGADHARTNDTDKNVVTIGKSIADILNKNGVPTAHCTIMHDSIQYKDSYARAEETIKQYLEEYPSIKLVIDVHRDAVIKSSGEIVRPITELEGEAAAQVMCVVGSDWGGDECSNWENNLSLALKLRERLNNKCKNICRPVNLKSSTYNQELAPYSLLLEVGASGNSLNEAQRSVKLIGEILSELINEI